MKRAGSALGLALALLACKGEPKQEASSSSTTGSAAASTAAAPSAAPVAPAAWFVGAWQGTYEAELQRIELAAGGVKEWKKDDGTSAAGAGKLSFEAKSDGSVAGSASGPLGEQKLSGHVEGDRVALSLTPADPNGFQGMIVASQAGEGIQGNLSASTGDSLTVRRAKVTLAKAGK